MGLMECEECGEEFYATRIIEITYSTKKARKGMCLRCKKENIVIESWTSSAGQYTDLCNDCGQKEKELQMKTYIRELNK